MPPPIPRAGHTMGQRTATLEAPPPLSRDQPPLAGISIVANAQQGAEVLRCARSCSYFIQTYGKTIDPTTGVRPFWLFNFQVSVLANLLSYWATFILKPRQMGLTWLVCAYALWVANFHPSKNVLIISITDDFAKRALRRVQFMYRNLPPFLRVGMEAPGEERGTIGNDHEIRFANGSSIRSNPSSPSAGRGEPASLLILDEVCFIRWIDDIVGAALPTLSTGGQVIALTSAGNVGAWGHSECLKAAAGDSAFKLLRLYWTDYPTRDDAWHAAQEKLLGPVRCAQEVDCQFLSAGTPFFDIAALRDLEDWLHANRVRPLDLQHDRELIIFETPQSGMSYTIGADTATGYGFSGQAAYAIETTTGRQVAEYKGKLGIDAYAGLLNQLGRYYNGANLAVERNNTGRAVLVHLRDILNYPNLYEYVDPMTGETDDREPGWETNSSSRPMILDNVESLVRCGPEESGIRSLRTLNQMFTFILTEQGRPQHAKNCNDDLVIAAGIANWTAGRIQATPKWNAGRVIPVGR